ncbi:MAG TPA: hypothetical protein VIT88_02995 [Pyrinomonadaceae bacterium]
MRRLSLAALLSVLCLIPSIALAKTILQAKPSALHLVQKIYVDEMGTSAEALRFRLLLEDQLSAKGFTVVDRPEKADAVLGGALSVNHSGIFGGDADVGVTTRLTSAAGERLWGHNAGGQITIFNPVSALKVKEPIEYRAKELAKRLRSDWDKSARAAGVRTSR